MVVRLLFSWILFSGFLQNVTQHLWIIPISPFLQVFRKSAEHPSKTRETRKTNTRAIFYNGQLCIETSVLSDQQKLYQLSTDTWYYQEDLPSLMAYRNGWCVCVCVCVCVWMCGCVCVCVRERERERESKESVLSVCFSDEEDEGQLWNNQNENNVESDAQSTEQVICQEQSTMLGQFLSGV